MLRQYAGTRGLPERGIGLSSVARVMGGGCANIGGGLGNGLSESAETMWSVFDQFVMLTVAFKGPLESQRVPNVRHYRWLFGP